MISHASEGSSMNRLSGAPICVRRGFPSSWTTHRRTIQVPSSQPLTSDHRPFTRNPPGTTRACPEVRVLFAVMTSGLAWIVRAASGESWAAVQCVFPFHTHHATEASARANSSNISSASLGVRSSPPYALGRKMRKNPAQANSRVTSSGSRREASMRSRSANIRGRNVRATSRSEVPAPVSGMDPSGEG